MTAPASHASRDHALWSASSTSRNWACPGALALGQSVRHLDVESEAAGWGTACHEISEKCLRTGLDADSQIAATIKTKSHSFEVDEEMAECAQVYVDYVRSRMTRYRMEFGQDATLWIEERFTLDKLKPPFQAGGTGDAVMYFPNWFLIEVVDLKGGRGIRVEVTENKQLRTYALGAVLAHPDCNVSEVQSTIVQPRMEHKDGRIRSERLHITELMEWTVELTNAMNNSAEAIKEYAEVKGELTREKWAGIWLTDGDHCTFCPAAAICPALESKALATANAFFNDTGAVEIRNQPSELDPSRIAQVLDGADTLQNWLNAVRATATRLAEQGAVIPGYHLADKFGHRKFKGAENPAPALKALGLDDDVIYDTRPIRSPAQMEKKIRAPQWREKDATGATLKERFEALIHKPKTGVSLVSSAKSNKPPVQPAAEKFFA